MCPWPQNKLSRDINSVYYPASCIYKKCTYYLVNENNCETVCASSYRSFPSCTAFPEQHPIFSDHFIWFHSLCCAVNADKAVFIVEWKRFLLNLNLFPLLSYHSMMICCFHLCWPPHFRFKILLFFEMIVRC